MITLELFSGTESFSKVMRKYHNFTRTIDIDASFNPDIIADILTLNFKEMDYYDFIWASPPCQAFSVASIGTHWTGGNNAYIPKTDKAKLGIKLLERTIEIIAWKHPKYWCIENPRGVMRKVIEPIFQKYGLFHRRITLSYCQYGDSRMKPTDIWTNIPNWEGKMCANRNRNHISAPRGSKTGTQGLKNAKERSVIPSLVFEEMLNFIEVDLK